MTRILALRSTQPVWPSWGLGSSSSWSSTGFISRAVVLPASARLSALCCPRRVVNIKQQQYQARPVSRDSGGYFGAPVFSPDRHQLGGHLGLRLAAHLGAVGSANSGRRLAPPAAGRRLQRPSPTNGRQSIKGAVGGQTWPVNPSNGPAGKPLAVSSVNVSSGGLGFASGPILRAANGP